MNTRILVIDDEVAISRSIATVMESEGLATVTAADAAEGIAQFREHGPAVVLCDIRLPDASGIDVLRTIRESSRQTVVIMMTAYATVETTIEALKLGAADYLLKPILFDDLLHRIQHYLEHRSLVEANENYRELLRRQQVDSVLVGDSPPLSELHARIGAVAATTSTVLIRGESGTGKELIAQEIHRRSRQSAGPYVAVNASAVPETLLESELFGYRRGAFSGADRDREGMVALASGGTLFLDEIGDLPLALQPKILRVLENREFYPLGADRPIEVNARIVLATHRDLEAMVRDGDFREDLFYRVNAIEIAAPPLRACRDDIPALAQHLLARFNRELGKDVRGFEPNAMASLSTATWKGNVRELANRIHRALVFCDGDELTHIDLWGHCEAHDPQAMTLRDAVSCFERRLVLEMVERCDGDKRVAADRLGVSLATLYGKLKAGATDAELETEH